MIWICKTIYQIYNILIVRFLNGYNFETTFVLKKISSPGTPKAKNAGVESKGNIITQKLIKGKL